MNPGHKPLQHHLSFAFACVQRRLSGHGSTNPTKLQGTIAVVLPQKRKSNDVHKLHKAWCDFAYGVTSAKFAIGDFLMKFRLHYDSSSPSLVD